MFVYVVHRVSMVCLIVVVALSCFVLFPGGKQQMQQQQQLVSKKCDPNPLKQMYEKLAQDKAIKLSARITCRHGDDRDDRLVVRAPPPCGMVVGGWQDATGF